MDYLSRNYSLNQSYFISHNSFDDIAKHVLKKQEFKNIKFSSINTVINNKQSSFIITIKITSINDPNITKTLKDLVKLIENKILDLFEIQPENIVINLDGEF